MSVCVWERWCVSVRLGEMVCECVYGRDSV